VAIESSGNNVINVNGDIITMQAQARSGYQGDIPGSAVWTQDSETFTVRMEDESLLLLEAPSTTVRMKAGSATAIGDTIYSVPSSGGVLIHDGTPITVIHTVTTNSAEKVTVSENSDSPISAFNAGNSVIVVVDGSTLTLSDGSETSFGGHLISALSNGRAVVADGTKTITVGARTSLTSPSDSASDANKVEHSLSTSATSNVAIQNTAPVFKPAILMLSIGYGIFYL
jgi:hypothetical protein